MTFLGSQESSQVFCQICFGDLLIHGELFHPFLLQTLLMRWGSLNGFVQNVLHQASPGLTTIGWLWPSEGLGGRLAIVSDRALPREQCHVWGYGWNRELASHSSWLNQPGNFLW